MTGEAAEIAHEPRLWLDSLEDSHLLMVEMGENTL
jgi:hypothetical protein